MVPDAAAEVVRLFERYLALGSVGALKAELDAEGIVSVARVTRAGRRLGGKPYSRGALYTLLSNRVYRGDIRHKDTWHPGPHEPIVPEALWNAVQARLEQQRTERKLGSRAREASLLAGMVVDGEGHRLTPSHTVKAGKRYRYYLGRGPAQSPREHGGSSSRTRTRRLCVPAYDLERRVGDAWKAVLGSPDLDVTLGIEDLALGQTVRAAAAQWLEAWDRSALPEQRRILLAADLEVRVEATRITLAWSPKHLLAALTSATVPDRTARNTRTAVRHIAACVIRHHGETRIVAPDSVATAPRPQQQTLLRAIAQGQRWHRELIEGRVTSIAALARRHQVSTAHVLHTLRCGWLAPDLVEQLLQGRARASLARTHVRDHFISDWNEQRQRWG